MQCPNCNETLVMADRQGIEVDYCPKCRGVWLDRGELDKIIERSAAYTMGPNVAQQPDIDREHYKDYPYQKDYHDDPRYKHKKKKGFLDDFFDF
jgi:uncharacterized protein